jgi:electron transfer flavoprotein alpha subunit
MANIAIYVELRGGHPTEPSRFAVQQGRAISDVLGATVYAVIPVGPVTYPELERISINLGRMGADRVVVCTDAALGGPPIAATHGRLLRAVTMKIHPRLFLFPAGTIGPQLAAPLAAQLRATYFPGAVVTNVAFTDLSDPPGALHLGRHAWGSEPRTLDVMNTDRPIVATLASLRPEADAGGGEAELELLSYPTSVSPMITETDLGPDPAEAEELAWAWMAVAPEATAAAAQRLRRAAEMPGLVVVEGESSMADVACPAAMVMVGAGSGGDLHPLPPPGALVAACDRAVPDPARVEVTLHWKVTPTRAAGALADALKGGEDRVPAPPAKQSKQARNEGKAPSAPTRKKARSEGARTTKVRRTGQRTRP